MSRPWRILRRRARALLAAGAAAAAGLAAEPPAPPAASAPHPAAHEIIISIIGGSEADGRDLGFQALIVAYEKLHPEVRVLVESKGNGYGVGYPTWLNTQLASQAPRPDIVSANYSPDYAHYLNLDYYAGQTNPYTGRPLNEGLDFNFCKTTNSRGERILLSTQMVKVLWYYNRDVFDRLGLSPPKTWDEFLQTCERLRAAGLVPLSLRGNYRFYQWLLEILFDQYSRSYLNLIRAQPGDWCYDPARDGNWTYHPEDPFNDTVPTVNYARLLAAIRRGQIRYDNAAFIQTLDNLKSLTRYVPADFLVDTPSADAESYTLFLNGVAAIHLDQSSLLVQLDDDLAGAGRFRWGTFDPPSQVNALVQAPARGIESASGEYIGIIRKDQAQTDRVMDFLHFWFSPAGYQPYLDGQVASGRFRPSGRVMVRNVTLPRRFTAPFEHVVRRGNAEIQLNGIAGFFPPGSQLVNDFKQTLVDLVQGKVTSTAAAGKIQGLMQKAVEEIVARNRLDASFLDHPELDPNG